MVKMYLSLLNVPKYLRGTVVGNRNISTPSQEFDIAIVGGGIIGASTALLLKKQYPNLKAVIIEKESHLAAHQSGHNSGVIHAGIYYKPGSLKAKLCVRGMHLTYKYCDQHSIPYKKVGKLIVAVDESEVPRLDELYQRGLQNGVPDLQMIPGDKITEFEPHCKGVKAVWSPHTGIVDWAAVTRHYADEFSRLGGQILLNSEVISLAGRTEGTGSGLDHPLQVAIKAQRPVFCSHVICCGGLHSDRLAALSGCSREPRIVPFRGEYLLLKPDKQHLVRGNIYPVPDPRFPFLGVHFTPRMDGSVWLGPNAVLATEREGYSWSHFSAQHLVECIRYRGFRRIAMRYAGFGASEMLRSWFVRLQVAQLRRYLPEITADDVIRGPAGVRAQALDNDGNLVDEFVMEAGSNERVSQGSDLGHGVPQGSALGYRFLHVRNAPSPAATSSLAIAETIVERASTQFQL